ncbi:hypothetical protein CR513_00330, partial [Mucuna pruriens]
MEILLPLGWKSLNLERYDDTTNLDKHVNAYTTSLVLNMLLVGLILPQLPLRTCDKQIISHCRSLWSDLRTFIQRFRI